MLTTLTKINYGSVLRLIKGGGYGICSALLLLGGVAQSARADSFSFRETLGDKVITHREDGETFFEIVRTGTFNFRSMTKWQGIGVPVINAETEIRIDFGSFHFEGNLGADPKFKAGKGSATFVAASHFNEKGKLVKDSIVTVRWNNKNVYSIAVSGKLSDERDAVLADQFLGEDGATTDGTHLAVTFAGLDLGQFVNLKAKTTRKTVRKGKGDDAQEFLLTKVTVTGKPASSID